VENHSSLAGIYPGDRVMLHEFLLSQKDALAARNHHIAIESKWLQMAVGILSRVLIYH